MNKKTDNQKFNYIVPIIIAAIVLTLMLNSIISVYSKSYMKEITYTEFLEKLNSGNIAKVEMESDRILIQPNYDSETPLSEQYIYYTGKVDDPDLIPLLKEKGIDFYGVITEQTSPIVSFILSWILPIAVMYLIFSLLTKGLSKRMGGTMSFGQSTAKVYVEKKTGVTFADVAGQDEAKESLEEIIDFLHNPQKYAAIGAKLPKGALLVGAPGTGKTLLAKAVAGEANVPFFSISGSDFVEMFVGVGASRVRDLFLQASKQAPCIIFIDEIDAIGKSRDNRMGGNDEREQTLNQLLAEIDGFDSSKGVVILAATNRPEVLDKALLRAGRFDRRIPVDRPNLAGRIAILQVHTKNIRLSEDVNLNKIALATAGAVGADLANLVNEAALRAVRLGRGSVNQDDLLISFEVVIAGTEKKGTVLTEKEKKIVAWHEVGHAMVAALEKNSQPVQKITIVPHTSGALGYTMQTPEEEKYLSSKDEMLTELRTLVAGRAAEQLVFGIQTTGASNDLEKATDMARRMILLYGMSDTLGLAAFGTVTSQYLDANTVNNCAEETSAAIDREVIALLGTCYKDSLRILSENRAKLDEIAAILYEKETLSGDELMSILNGKPLPNPDSNENLLEAGSSDEAARSSEPYV